MPHLQFSSQVPSPLVLEFAKSRSTKTSSLGLEKPLDMPLYPSSCPLPLCSDRENPGSRGGRPKLPTRLEVTKSLPLPAQLGPAWPGRALHAGQLSSK